jgi:putative oxidoreductase
MPVLRLVDSLESALAALARLLEAPATLAARLYVGWVFVHSGLLKVMDWEQTRALFETEYRVPLLSPGLAAVAGAGGELVFGALVIVGLAGRSAALGLAAVNAMAVISYRHVLFGDGFEAALGQHLLWGALLAALFICGPGRWSADALASALRGRAGSGTRTAAPPPT